MKLRSRGLGRKELVMDFRRYEIRRDGDEVLITGTITQPVTWDFSIRIEQDDIPGLIRVARSKAMASLFFQWIGRIFSRIFKRTSKELSPKAEPQTVAYSSGEELAQTTRSGRVTSTPQTRSTPQARSTQKGDSAERRRKIQEARRQLERRQQRSGDRAGSDRRERSATSASAPGWNLTRVGSIPSGNRGSAKAPARVQAEQVGEDVGSLEADERSAVAASSGGWNARRPGALPKVS